MFPRKSVLLLLLAMIMVSLALRYPLVEHERFQTDSYFIHILSNDIVREGQAAWTFNSLSYVGYYPFSYPSGVPFLLAELSLLTGMNVDVSILLVDGILATLFCLVVFCLAREFVQRVEFGLLIALITAIAPRFVDTTYWNGSARGMGVVLITLCVFVLLRASFSRSNMLFVISGLIGVGCFAVHHMAVMIILFGVGYVFAVLSVRYLPRVFQNRGKRWAALSAVSIGVIGTIVAMNYFELLGNSLQAFGEEGFFVVKNPVIAALSNLVVSYTHQIGIVLVFAAFGAIAFLKAPRFFVRGMLPLTILIVFVPVLGSSLYVSMLISPFVATMGVAWLRDLGKSKRVKTKTFTAVLAIVLVLSLTTTVLSVDRWNRVRQLTGDSVEVDNLVFNDATYLNLNDRGIYAVCNGEALVGELSAYSNTSFIVSGVVATISKDVTKRDIQNNITASSTPFPGNLYSWYSYKDTSLVGRFVIVLMSNGVSITRGVTEPFFRDYVASHSNLLVVVDNSWPTEYASVYGQLGAPFLSEVRNSQASTPGHEDLVSYCTYVSQRSTMYMVRLPLT